MSNSQKAFSGFLNNFSYTLIAKAITLAGNIFLARLLTPNDFGLVAMLFIFFEVATFLIDGGFGLSLVREKEITEEDKTTAFYFNLMMGVFMYIIIWFASPFIASFYGEPQLVLLSRIMGLNFVFASFGLVQRAIFQRNLKFKQLGLITAVGALLINIVSIALAYWGLGVKALAIKYTVGNLVAAGMFYWLMPWKPTGFIHKNSFKKLFSFGMNVMMLGVIDTISKNLHKVVIGKVYNTASLGVFNQANTLKDNIINPFNQAIIGVTFPMMAKLQTEKGRVKDAYAKILKLSCYLIFPLVTYLIISAHPLILFLFGKKWLGAVIFVKILACTGYVRHLHSINLNILKVYGKGKDYLTQGILRNGLIIIALIISVNISIIAIAWSLIIVEFLQLSINVYYSNKYIKFTFAEQLKNMLPIIILNICNAAVLLVVSQIVIHNHFLKLMVLFGTFVVFYFSASKLFNMSAYQEVETLVFNKLKRRKKNGS